MQTIQQSSFDRVSIDAHIRKGFEKGVFTMRGRNITGIKLPPVSVLYHARKAKSLSAYYRLLFDYYELPVIPVVKNPRLSRDTWAQFATPPPRIETPRNGINEKIAIHEFYHYARWFLGLLREETSMEQRMADQFAEAVSKLR